METLLNKNSKQRRYVILNPSTEFTLSERKRVEGLRINSAKNPMGTKKTKKTTDSNWQKAKDWGVDLSIIDANLQKTPTERARIHQMSLDLALALREAGKKYYNGLSRSHKTSR